MTDSKCLDCREIRDDGPNWMGQWDNHDKDWQERQG